MFEIKLLFCSDPNVPRSPEVVNHHWYGLDVSWTEPLGNKPDRLVPSRLKLHLGVPHSTNLILLLSFEIKIDISGEDAWFDVGYVTEYKLRNSATPDDFYVSGTSNNLDTAFSSNSGVTVKTLDPSSVYVVQIRAVYACGADSSTRYGEAVSAVGVTAPYPPKAVQLEPLSTSTMQITWEGIQAPELTYDVIQCSHDMTNCTAVVAANLTTDNYLLTGKFRPVPTRRLTFGALKSVLGLNDASMYCYEVVAKFRGLESRVRDRYDWLTDYDYAVDPAANHVEDNTLFTETHLTWTNYTHAYFDALCSCTCTNF